MQITHKALFEKLKDDTVVQKARRYSHWTLPQLMADFSEKGASQRLTVERDWQEIGALLVNNLASKLARLLFPVNAPFFKIELSEQFKAMIASQGKETEMQGQLAKFEMQASRKLFVNGSYSQLMLALRHLVVTGNVLLHRDPETALTCAYGLPSFVIRRDGKGRMLDCVLREYTVVEGLPWEIQQLLLTLDRPRYSRPECQVELYTRIHREHRGNNPVYVVTQQVDTLAVGGESVYPEHLCPWQAPVWNLILGEHYGRGHVEDYAGGFAKLSDLSEAATLYGIEIMRIVHLVAAGNGTDVDDLATAETGEYIRGDGSTVVAHESGDARRLQVVEEQITAVVSRLSRAFMYQGATRDAERVTAYELQRDAQEAEYTLGGTYSSLSSSIQVPMAHVLLLEVNPDLLEGFISKNMKVDITAGVPALGRSSEVQSLALATQEVASIIPVLTQIDNRFSAQKLVDTIMAGRSVDTSGLQKSNEELAQEAQAAQQQQLGMQQIAASQQAAGAAEQLGNLTAQ